MAHRSVRLVDHDSVHPKIGNEKIGSVFGPYAAMRVRAGLSRRVLSFSRMLDALQHRSNGTGRIKGINDYATFPVIGNHRELRARIDGNVAGSIERDGLLVDQAKSIGLKVMELRDVPTKGGDDTRSPLFGWYRAPHGIKNLLLRMPSKEVGTGQRTDCNRHIHRSVRVKAAGVDTFPVTPDEEGFAVLSHSFR